MIQIQPDAYVLFCFSLREDMFIIPSPEFWKVLLYCTKIVPKHVLIFYTHLEREREELVETDTGTLSHAGGGGRHYLMPVSIWQEHT